MEKHHGQKIINSWRFFIGKSPYYMEHSINMNCRFAAGKVIELNGGFSCTPCLMTCKFHKKNLINMRFTTTFWVEFQFSYGFRMFQIS